MGTSVKALAIAGLVVFCWDLSYLADAQAEDSAVKNVTNSGAAFQRQLIGAVNTTRLGSGDRIVVETKGRYQRNESGLAQAVQVLSVGSVR